MQNPHFGSKIKKSKKHLIIHPTDPLELFPAKNRSKKHQIFQKWHYVKNWLSCKGYRPCQILTLGQKLKFQKTCHNPFYKPFRVFSCKKRSKKHQIFQKWNHVKNRLSCKGYRPCQILTLGQKLKFQKTCHNPFYKPFRVLSCKKRSKKHQIFQKWHHVKNGPSCKRYSPCKILTLDQKLKFQKNMSESILQIIYTCSVQKTAPKNTNYSRNDTILKIGHHTKAKAHAKSSLWVKYQNSKTHLIIHSTNHLDLFVAKNRSKKHQIFQKWHHFKNQPSSKGYSPCKILTLGQKLKFQNTCYNPFYKAFRVVSCKKPLQKIPNIPEMTPFWKLAIM